MVEDDKSEEYELAFAFLSQSLLINQTSYKLTAFILKNGMKNRFASSLAIFFASTCDSQY